MHKGSRVRKSSRQALSSVYAGCLSLCAEFATAAGLWILPLPCTIARGTICWRVVALKASQV